MYIQIDGEKLSRQENAIVVVFTFYGKPEKSVKPTQGRKNIYKAHYPHRHWMAFMTNSSLPPARSLLPAPFSIRSMAPLVSKSVCLTVCGLQLSWLIVLTQNMFNNTFCPKANVLFYVWILYAVCAMLRLSALLILIVNNDSRFLFLALVLSLFSHWTIRVARPCKSGWALLIPLLSRLRPSSTS